ncbi:TetR/AcrR family transcriptional regulator [Sciscionella marina]|uniref:TetR/AcrR family transcriptional regulator n=1 Tax=Sciscionella marina TaxID=508770 RepID=UPI00037E10A5|nr:TetR/AcrR family transcriptional regulator [Sciscionella marina]
MTDSAERPRADAARARLLDAATSAFAEKGFHGTTTRDIAEAAGMSPAALYVHHKSKEELLYLISHSGHQDTLRLVRETIESAADPVNALRAVIHEFAAHHAQGHTRARIVNYELAALTPAHSAEISAIRHRIQDEIRALVERGAAAGVFEVPDPAMAAIALLSLGIDIARWYREEGRWTPEDVAERYAEIALRIVGVR